MCNVCQGYSGVSCPVCGRGSLTEHECDACNGLGHAGYFAFDIIKREFVKCTETAWLALPVDEDDAEIRGKRYCRMEVEPCPICGGEGYVLK